MNNVTCNDVLMKRNCSGLECGVNRFNTKFMQRIGLLCPTVPPMETVSEISLAIALAKVGGFFVRRNLRVARRAAVEHMAGGIASDVYNVDIRSSAELWKKPCAYAPLRPD